MSAPRVTVVTPSFNQAQFLEETIESVLGQGYPNLEYAIVDGGSTDGSVDIIRRYEDRLAWWESGPDGGQPAALTKAFDRASGDYLGWINSDDTLLPGSIARVVDELERRPDALLAYGGIHEVDEDGRRLRYVPPHDIGVRRMLEEAAHIAGQQGSLFRRRLWELARPFDSSYYLFDAKFVVKAHLLGEVVAVDEPLGTYRLHGESATVADPARRAWEYVRFYEELPSWPELTPELRRAALRGRAHAFGWAAYLFYAGEDHRLARRYIVRAARANPRAFGWRSWRVLLKALVPLRARRLVRGLRPA